MTTKAVNIETLVIEEEDTNEITQDLSSLGWLDRPDRHLYVAPQLNFIGWVGLACVTVILAIVIHAVAIQTFRIPSLSMSPTLKVGDNVLVNKLSYGLCVRGLPFALFWMTPKRGEVVVFHGWNDGNYDDNGDYFIKRVVAVPGDTVQVRNFGVYVNGKILSDVETITQNENANNHIADNRFRNIGAITLKDNEYYVMGDNRENSEDSRVHGPINLSQITGRASFVYWSWVDQTENVGSNGFIVNWNRIGLRI